MEGGASPASIPAFLDLFAKYLQTQASSLNAQEALPDNATSEGVASRGKDKSKNDSTARVSPTGQSNSRAKGQKKPKQWVFGLPRSQNAASDQVLSQDDYEQKYPADAYCEELGPNARVYKVYIDEAGKHDDETVDSWRDNLDVLLVFAGLFSAVVTTFVVEVSNKLDIDWSEMNARLLAESNAIQRAIATSASLDDVPKSEMYPEMDFVPKATDRWINGLWFVSLGFSLATALFAVLVKQWLKHYRSTIAGSARDRAHITQSRREALERWKVPTIVGLLPVLLHISLFMFFAGLAVFLYPLEPTSFGITTAIVAITLAAYIITTLLPLRFPQCSYVTPLTWVAYAAIQSIRLQAAFIKPTLHLIRLQISSWLHEYQSYISDELIRAKKVLEELRHTQFHNVLELERKSVCGATAAWDAQTLVWLQSTASLHPTVSPILLQAIGGLPVDYPDSLSRLLVQANIHHFYPTHVKPWTSLLIGSEHKDPRQCYLEKDQNTAERYMRACIQFNARLYGSDRIWTDDKFDWTHGALLFSLPCFFNAWDGMKQYGDECEYIRTLCASPWHQAEQPRHQSQCASRFTLIFTAFLRYQASADKEDTESLHPVIWEQMLRYIINFLSPKQSAPSSTNSLTDEEKAFIRRSGQHIFWMMLQDRHANNVNVAIPIFALRWQFPDGGTQELHKPEATQRPTTLFQLPRRYYLLRFLSLSTALGSSMVQRSPALQDSRFHQLFPIESEFIQRLPECYLSSLMQLLDYAPLAQTERGSGALASEIMSCTFYIKHFFKGFDSGNMNYSTTEVERKRALDSDPGQEAWRAERWEAYLTTIRYALDKLNDFICEGGYEASDGQVQRNFIRAFSQCELCLRDANPAEQFFAFTPILMRKLLDFMLLIPTIKHRNAITNISVETIWVDNTVFYLLWRSFKEGDLSASEMFVHNNGIMAIIDGLRWARELSSWNDTQFSYYTLPIAFALLGFIQGFTERRGPESVMTYISSPRIFPALCSILFPAFLSHPSYRTTVEPAFLKYNLNALWHELLKLTKFNIGVFREAWREVFRRRIELVHPKFKKDHVRVEELKEMVGLIGDPLCTQYIIMKTTEIPTALDGHQHPLTPPQLGLVQIDYRLIHPYLDENMEIQGDNQQMNQSSPSSSHRDFPRLDSMVEESRENSHSLGALARIGIAKHRFRSPVSRVSDQV